MVVALACSIGVHWAFLQSFAWSAMFLDNLATTSFSAALQRTFDGKHPCALCKAIAKGKTSEKRSATLLSLKKIEGLRPSGVIALFPPASFLTTAEPEAFIEALAYAPPTPPPRSA